MQGGHHIELLHDWIEGRIVARRTSSRRWVFVPAREVMSAAERLAHELLDAVRDGRAVVRPIPGGVEIVLDAQEGTLTNGESQISMPDMSSQSRYEPRRPDERMKTTSLKWFPSDAEAADRAAASLGVATRVFIRRAIRDAAERVLKAG